MIYWLAPLSFLLFLPLGLALIYFVFVRRKKTSAFLSRMPGPWKEMLQFMKQTRRAYRSLFLLQIFGMLLLILALARPARQKTIVQKYTEGIDISLILDVSESMDAEDLKPSRILAAKQVIRQFISQRPNDRIGLVVFGGESVMKSPLTRDFDFLLQQVEAIKLRELKQGTAIGLGLTNGIARLRKSKTPNKILILLTDGDSNVGAINPITAAKLAVQEGIRIYTIGIGEKNRVVVPIYAYNSEGRKTHLVAQVPSYLNPELLQEIATITGGKSYMARDSGMLSRILQEIDKLEKTKIQLTAKTEFDELFFYPLLLGSLCLFFSYLLLETRYQRRQQAFSYEL